jgi:hypothetical protein
MNLRDYEESYGSIITYIDNVIDTMILTKEKIVENGLSEEEEILFWKQQWNNDISDAVVNKLNDYLEFVRKFHDFCIKEEENIYIDELSEIKHTIEVMVCLIMNINSNNLILSSIKTFTDKWYKNRKQYKFIQKHLDELLPNAPTTKPIKSYLHDLMAQLFIDNNETFDIEAEMIKKGY